MFGDAVVYALSLYPLRRGARWQAGAALLKVGIILLIGFAVSAQIIDRIVNGVPPSSTLMLIFGGLALAAKCQRPIAGYSLRRILVKPLSLAMNLASMGPISFSGARGCDKPFSVAWALA